MVDGAWMAGVAEMGKSHTINKENLFKNRGGNRGGTDRGGPRPPVLPKTFPLHTLNYHNRTY